MGGWGKGRHGSVSLFNGMDEVCLLLNNNRNNRMDNSGIFYYLFMCGKRVYCLCEACVITFQIHISAIQQTVPIFRFHSVLSEGNMVLDQSR